MYKICVHKPIFKRDRTTEIINLIPPPEFHLMNTVCKHIHQNFERVSDNWAKTCNVTREIRYKKVTSAGNSCKSLLNKVDILQRLWNQSNIDCLGFVDCFQDFCKVMDSYFSNTLFDSEIKRDYESACSVSSNGPVL